jgi:hypothetical protein
MPLYDVVNVKKQDGKELSKCGPNLECLFNVEYLIVDIFIH